MLILGFLLGVATTVVAQNFLKQYTIKKKDGNNE